MTSKQAFLAHLSKSHEKVASWPEWKRDNFTSKSKSTTSSRSASENKEPVAKAYA